MPYSLVMKPYLIETVSFYAGTSEELRLPARADLRRLLAPASTAGLAFVLHAEFSKPTNNRNLPGLQEYTTTYSSQRWCDARRIWLHSRFDLSKTRYCSCLVISMYGISGLLS